MSTMLRLFLLGCAASLHACTVTDPLYCSQDVPCSDPARPFCDLNGEYPASEGIARTCIPDPNDDSDDDDGGDASDGNVDAGNGDPDGNESADGGSDAGTAPCNSRLAFSNDRTGTSDVYVVNRDGRGLANVTNNGSADETAPAWSPDGTHIVYSLDIGKELNVNLLDLARGTSVPITKGPDRIAKAVWSGDGLKLAFARPNSDGPSGDTDVVVINRDGTGLVVVAGSDSIISQTDPNWDPSADRLAWVDGTTSTDIFRGNADGLGQSNLTNDAAFDREPNWSPDGQLIAFRTSQDGDPEIFVMNADGSNQANLTNHTALDEAPAWSPSGDRIAFISTRSGNEAIWVMRADGSDPVQVSAGRKSVGSPVWSPDGTQIAYSSNGDVYVASVDGSKEINLTNGNGSSNSPTWEPCPK